MVYSYRVRHLLKSKMVPALLSIALGIVIIIARRAALDLLVMIIGGLVVASGIGFIAVYLTRTEKEAGNLKMVALLAGAAVLTGLLLIVFAGYIVDIFPVIMGIYLIMNGLSHLTEAYVDRENRVLATVLGAVVIALGLFIVFRPDFLVDMTMVFIGVSFLVNGAMDLLLLRRVKRELL